MKSLTLILAVASLLIVFITMPAKAGMEITNPYSGVTWKGGSPVKITWVENNKSPLLTALNSLTLYLMAGTQDSQNTVATIASGVSGSALSCDYTVPTNAGPPGSFYFIKASQASLSYLAYSGYFNISDVSGTIPNFNPSNPGTPLSSTATSSNPSSTLSSSNNSTSTASASNSAATKSAASTKSGSSATSQVLGTPTATSVSSGSTGGATNTPAPTSKSSDSNKLATNSYVLSLALFIIAFYLY